MPSSRKIPFIEKWCEESTEVLAEREACATLLETVANRFRNDPTALVYPEHEEHNRLQAEALEEAAKMIRIRRQLCD